jgi:hypothetical protein
MKVELKITDGAGNVQLYDVSGSFIPEEEIKQAAKEDYDRQRKYNNAYDRQKGFTEGVKWVMKRLKNYR